MVMVPDKYIEFITNLKELVNEGKSVLKELMTRFEEFLISNSN